MKAQIDEKQCKITAGDGTSSHILGVSLAFWNWIHPVMVTADHGLAGARYAENYLELHHFHLDLRDVKAFAVCALICFTYAKNVKSIKATPPHWMRA